MIRDELRHYELADRYRAESGHVFLSGIGALARIPVEQLRLDHQRGHSSAALVSGYPGSPLGGFDHELARALRLVPDLPIVHQPAVNEELAASAVMGSQLASTRGDLRYDGVVGIWYGKAPGLDRATDALRHGVFAGSSAGGGALALVGDDPAAKSSTMPSSSDAALVDLHMPILYPGTIAECLELGLHGIAMSRATGLWSSMKIVTPIADGTGTVELPVSSADPVLPTHRMADGTLWSPHPSAQFLGPRMVDVEQEFQEVRLELAGLYGKGNGLNRLTSNPRDAWIGIVATGYTYFQLLEALRRLGLSNLDQIADAGIRLLHLRMPVPFDTDQVKVFAGGLQEIFVVEEKNPTLERLIRDCLYDQKERPVVVGKRAPDGATLLPSHGLLNADVILSGLRTRLSQRLEARLAPLPAAPRERIPLSVNRAPFFCSGCPHNWGTKVPPGSVVGMGTGCHGMTLLMDEDRVGESIGITAMGNEGAQWIGMAPFVETKHVFQNFGDGTYFHSGQLAVQAAIGAGVNVTFKILYNDTVAMTGGQKTAHRVGVPELARLLLTHGVTEVVITAEDLTDYKGVRLPSGVKVLDRTKLIAIQERLATVPGVTVIIHDQECAAEIRRGRRRGTVAKAVERVVINHRICEGCGDCGDVSSCLSVQPMATPLGRKTQIDQASCNVDLSCLEGDCPAFMTIAVDEDSLGLTAGLPPQLPENELASPRYTDREATSIRLSGIGGTGVVTAAQMLGTAAMLDGLQVDGVDQTGLSQKAGPVISDLVLSSPSGPRRSNQIGRGQADVLVAFDELVAASDAAIGVADEARTRVFASTSVTPTGTQITKPWLTTPSESELASRFGFDRDDSRLVALDGLYLAHALTGTASTANTLLIGATIQSGEIPVSVEAFERAIALNGVAIDQNLSAFAWGRRWFVNREEVEQLANQVGARPPKMVVEPLSVSLAHAVDGLDLDQSTRALVEILVSDLVAYQDEAYARRLIQLLGSVSDKQSPELVEAVARNAHKLMAYKDEYEVARLLLAEDGLAALDTVPGQLGRSRVSWLLHPPALRTLGLQSKVKFPYRSQGIFQLLARGKKVRGTKLDPFGHAALRKIERIMVDEYFDAIALVAQACDGGNCSLERAIEIANLPDSVRGFESLKLERATQYRNDLADALVTM